MPATVQHRLLERALNETSIRRQMYNSYELAIDGPVASRGYILSSQCRPAYGVTSDTFKQDGVAIDSWQFTMQHTQITHILYVATRVHTFTLPTS